MRNRRKRIYLGGLLVAALALLSVGLLRNGWGASQAGVQANLALAAPAAMDASGFTQAEPGRPLVFPADHGPHEDYQTEWWYYTGNLQADSGERFGYQLTFFRRALLPPAQRDSRASAWGTEQVYMAHLAITDVAGGRHYAFERFSRGAVGLAGAQAAPFRVWLEDWSVEEAQAGAYMLDAEAEGIRLQLHLEDVKGPVLHGDAGYSRKGRGESSASHYYSLTRLDTGGTLRIGDREYTVEGSSWLDHEFSTSALGPGYVGWDWFSLQLDNGSELVFSQMRRADGAGSDFLGGLLVGEDGAVQQLGEGAVRLQVTAEWRSPTTGAIYPAGWIVALPQDGLQLTVTPYLADQEMHVSYIYWEGAVRVEGEAAGLGPITGSGYVELTGYAQSMEGQF